ncbi:anti-sigma B factor antagonist [Isoptericola jiangsuensis]|uniref:Anti-sigma B factor antagonist n=1 Tax=Isoptericola jiangsuensis TaxID=548579 RepID=A0A2A9ES17_9MICO|nr:STAS domain-containing protein [Isoptericola jiangsuensis]PFG41543.1 anti-sigma B factor antagonist [Isoptericola jiangsuensis]
MDDEVTHGGVRIDPDRARWTMWGEVDAAVQTRVAPDLATHLRETADEALTVDLTEVTFLDSGGLRLLYDAASAKPTPPVLVGTPPKVLDLLRLSGVDTLFVLQG